MRGGDDVCARFTNHGPAQVALFAYDNGSFINESYLPSETDVRIFVVGSATKSRNIFTGVILTASRVTLVAVNGAAVVTAAAANRA